MESRRGNPWSWARALGGGRSLGERAEDRALAWLKRRGLELLTRNFRCRYGEIDLVMRDRDTLVIVEVRCRDGASFARAALTVNGTKQLRLARAALAFIAQHPEFDMTPLRFDVLGIDGQPGRRVRPEWVRDAFRPTEG